uniref:Uncharacterized protein n=1 Tax=viral metagenome TaxID=1070528 RepID=A0A6M3XWH6_9ZZZZ
MSWQTIIDKEHNEQLEDNWRKQLPLKGTPREQDFPPVCKLFIPWSSGTWLLTEKDPDSSLCFGLCDLGMGCPEMGYVDLEELYSVTGPGGLKVERDLHWDADKTLSEYSAIAMREGHLQA